MGGVQRYPTPKWFPGNKGWMYNPKWGRNVVHIGVPIFLFSTLLFRHLNLYTVKIL